MYIFFYVLPFPCGVSEGEHFSHSSPFWLSKTQAETKFHQAPLTFSATKASPLFTLKMKNWIVLSFSASSGVKQGKYAMFLFSTQICINSHNKMSILHTYLLWLTRHIRICLAWVANLPEVNVVSSGISFE